MPVCYCDDGTMPPDWPFADWHRTMDLASMQLDRPLRIANKLKRWFREAGFVDVHEEVFKVPCNAWPRDSHLKNLGKVWRRPEPLHRDDLRLTRRPDERTHLH